MFLFLFRFKRCVAGVAATRALTLTYDLSYFLAKTHNEQVKMTASSLLHVGRSTSLNRLVGTKHSFLKRGSLPFYKWGFPPHPLRQCALSFSTKQENTENDTVPESPLEQKEITPKDYARTISDLSKARLSALVVSTSSFGFLAAATPICYTTLVAASLGTALCSASASTLNQIFEQDRDSRMKRTAQRPLVTKEIVGTNGAYALAATTGLTGGLTLYLGTDPITTALGVGNIALYAGAYTFMKPRSEWNTWVGAIVGAIPPVMGYTAATNGSGLFDIEAALLGGTLFLWQFPHFFALSWMHRVDYARGGFQVSCSQLHFLLHASILATEHHPSR